MLHILTIAAGGALGALLRYWTSVGVHKLFGPAFPYGTLTVNVIGSLLIGFLGVLMLERFDVGPEWRAGMLIGVLGAFTTFSNFSFETVNLLEQGEVLIASLNILFSVSLCLLAAWLGLSIGRLL